MQSVLAQTYPDVEYIVVDGDSQDGTQEIVGRYRDRLAQFISEPDRSLWEAMNKGIRLATGDYLYFLNSDDYLFDEHVLQDAANAIAANPCDYLYGNIQIRSITGHRRLQVSPYPEDLLESLILGCTLPHCGSFIKAELFEKLGYYSEHFRIGSDYEWAIKLASHPGLKILHFPRTIASFFVGGISSDWRPTMNELFEIQNQMPVYQSEYWLKKRVQKMQTAFLDQFELAKKSQSLAERAQALTETRKDLIATLQQELARLSSNRPLKLQHIWSRLRRKAQA